MPGTMLRCVQEMLILEACKMLCKLATNKEVSHWFRFIIILAFGSPLQLLCFHLALFKVLKFFGLSWYLWEKGAFGLFISLLIFWVTKAQKVPTILGSFQNLFRWIFKTSFWKIFTLISKVHNLSKQHVVR